MVRRPCCTCSAESARYRCPRCRLQYCSVVCCKKHKETCLPKEEKEALSSSSFPDVMSTRGDLTGENDESDAISLQKLLLLGNVCHCLFPCFSLENYRRFYVANYICDDISYKTPSCQYIVLAV
ncbi:zinc finger HIT domain-containing protein 3 isoform X2 [Bufo bufo]|uniref:zinc finger HIT domain-containing protein 3 isoform X2 n=1 Tax=Bufo bufo TaxID=8384 RepID=UPI001ABDAE21|nr:zinc finger HIT domain-containing protein 3 isoform X2 [Bufo bufo]